MMNKDKEAWHEARLSGIGASDATRLMKGEWVALWKIKTRREKEADLSHLLPVQMGIATEEFNRQWFAKQTGYHVATADCENLRTEAPLDFMRCNLDGRVIVPVQDLPNDQFFSQVQLGAVLECKHVGDKFTAEDIAKRYRWQVMHQLIVTGCPIAYLSVFFGNSRWQSIPMLYDQELANELIQAESEFWGYVTRDEEPTAISREEMALARSEADRFGLAVHKTGWLPE